MAVISGTYTRYDANGLREQLTETIYSISPEETPLSSSISRGSASQTLYEWQTDALAAADEDNAQLEGDEASYTTPAATVRVGNYTQILRKTALVSGTLEVVDKAGRKSEMAYQKAKRGKEMKLDLEKILFRAQAGNAGGTGTARRLASLNAWVKTNVDAGSGGGNPTYTAGVPGATRTDGTQRAFTETILKNTLQAVWTSGGKPRVLMVGPVNKAKVSGFSGIATRSFDISNSSPKPMAIIASVDVYVSDWGTVRVVPSRLQRERDAWVIDPEMLELAFLRPMKSTPMAKTGDADKEMLLMEVTLQVKQEAGLGLAADLTIT